LRIILIVSMDKISFHTDKNVQKILLSFELLSYGASPRVSFLVARLEDPGWLSR